VLPRLITLAELDALRDHYLLDLVQLGIRPFETDRLTIRDLLRLCRAAEELRRSRPDD
jgi:hypothetical protein